MFCWSVYKQYNWAAGWQKGPYDKIWKFESDAYFENSIHVDSWKFQWSNLKDKEIMCFLQLYSVSSLKTSFQNVTKHLTLLSFIYIIFTLATDFP